jgi:hypothetical protein
MPNGTLSVFALTFLAVSLPAGAQDGTGTLAGCVSDTANYRLPGVTVEVSAKRVKQRVVSDKDGCFRLTDLRPDTYAVFSTLTGFVPVTRDELRVRPDTVTRVNLQMHVSALCECIAYAPTVPELWKGSHVVARVRIVDHYRPADTSRGEVGHLAKVLRVWKGDVPKTVQFVQFPGDSPVDRVTEPYAIGQEFILFLWNDRKDGSLHIAGAFGFEDDRIHSAPGPNYIGRPVKDLAAEIGRLAGK